MTAIPAIYNPEGKLITETQAIANTFAEYYTKLYSSEVDDDLLKEQEFFDKIKLPCLNEQDQLILAGKITKDEIAQAISSLPYNKAPGEDGFPGEFYCWVKPEGIDVLFEVHKEAEKLVVPSHSQIKLS
ncbi:hypothetical protein NDU88_006620 [Pleurodeles waltl]|uniref:Uncharacterized protein n=1 Tax=Pleurodeles waltl TaxID=8319 RepID=A0AAV7LSI1_PLEWA|nr:hypothetical protein NDU88_006620 [Pleurodeles waltl]